ncbi:MAG: UDP-galactose 4-epimerase [Pseudomonadota bacterium]|jgi:UDP-glucose 4-epimerase
MSILVTGGAGYIGSHMVLDLLDAGETVVVLDNLSTGFRWAVPEQATFIEGDCGDNGLVGDLVGRHGVESIIHFAGSVVVPESVEKPLMYYNNNTAKSRSLIEAAVENGVRNFIFSSTAAVYGMPKENPVSEASELRPMSPYGSSKLMTEIMLKDAAAAHDLNYIALRYFNVAGADPRGRTGQSTARATHLIKVACEAALGKRGHMEVFGTDYPTADGSCVRDYIHVLDLARAHRDALAYLRRGGKSDVINCGYSRGFSVLDVIDVVKRVSGNDFEVRFGPRRAGDPAEIVAQSARARDVLGWRPELDDLEKIVTHALTWERGLEKRLARSA